MSVCRARSLSLFGIEALPVEVEVDVSSGLPGFSIVGLPDAAVQEARERVRVAISNSGYKFPTKKVIVNLAPANLRKEGPAFDLPIALGILAASGALAAGGLEGAGMVGELSLDGGLRGIKGALSMAEGARREGLARLLVPERDAPEAAAIGGVEVYGMRSLREAVEFLVDSAGVCPAEAAVEEGRPVEVGDDFADVAGQRYAKRALEVAAAGGHNLIMSGPPGSGKTMLARRMPGILPPLTMEERIEVTKVHSASGEGNGTRVRRRPFRAPHHTVSTAGLAGGGSNPRPGEVSLAHHGVFFLDELPEFDRSVLEVLRQPLEDQRGTISRAAMTLTFPASFMLAAAMNPCPCGYFGDPTRECRCTPLQIQRYVGRVSGPLLDRIDIHIDVPAVRFKELSERSSPEGEDSSSIRERVITARARQRERFRGSQVFSNALMSSRLIRRHCRLDADGERLLEQ